jgi:hypothetical protein
MVRPAYDDDNFPIDNVSLVKDSVMLAHDKARPLFYIPCDSVHVALISCTGSECLSYK